MLTINDPDNKVTAALLLDALQELRDAGAEAVQIGDVRVVADTWFADVPTGDRGQRRAGDAALRHPGHR